MAILPSHDVLALASSTLSLHARHNGKRLREKEICQGQALGSNALHISQQGTVLLACDDAIHEVKIPSLVHRTILSFAKLRGPKRAQVCAFGGRRVAVAGDDGVIYVYDWRRRRLLNKQSPPKGSKRLRSMAYSPDGKKLAVAHDGIGVWLYGPAQPGPVSAFRHASQALRFSPDGRALFGAVERFRSGLVTLKDGFIHRARKQSSWLSAIRFLGPDDVVTTSSDGSLMQQSAPQQSIRLDSQASEGLAVSRDGKAICMGTRSKQILCFRRGPAPAPSTIQAPKQNPSTDAKPGAALHAVLLRKQGAFLDIDMQRPASFKIGSRWHMSKRIEGGIGKLRFGAWLIIAKVTIVSARQSKLRLRIDRRLGNVAINKRNIEHFTAGSKLRLQRLSP